MRIPVVAANWKMFKTTHEALAYVRELGSVIRGLSGVEAQNVAKAASERAIREGITLQQAALEDPRVASIPSHEEIEYALDPAHYLGSTNDMIDVVLTGWK